MHVAAQSSWAPKKPSATAVHDGEQSRRSGSGAYSRADRGRRRSFSWLGVTDVQTYCGTHMRTPGDCRQVYVCSCASTGPPRFSDLDATGRACTVCCRLPPVSFTLQGNGGKWRGAATGSRRSRILCTPVASLESLNARTGAGLVHLSVNRVCPGSPFERVWFIAEVEVCEFGDARV